jgi:hypothetical protein
MISNLEPAAGTQPQFPFIRPVDDDLPDWDAYTVARLGREFQIGEFLIRRVQGDRFVIWNADGEMLQNDSTKIKSELRELFHEERQKTSNKMDGVSNSVTPIC